MEHGATIPAPEFRNRVQSASLVVSHAGIGTILTALQVGTPILVMPRRSDCGEHRSDHQVATVEALRGRQGVHVVMNERDLDGAIGAVLQTPRPVYGTIGPYALPALLEAVRAFLLDMPFLSMFC
jgi:UDP-N-acetylglucosamine transferase subunit ALG13